MQRGGDVVRLLLVIDKKLSNTVSKVNNTKQEQDCTKLGLIVDKDSVEPLLNI